MKILYCIAGLGYYGVLEQDIFWRDKFTISAKRVFSIEINSSQVIKSPGGEAMSYIISAYEDVLMNCTFISNMSENTPFYQRIMEIVEEGGIT